MNGHHTSTPPHMGGAEWAEVAVFWLVAFTLLWVLVLLFRPAGASTSDAPTTASG